MTATTPKKPVVGQRITVRGVACRIVAVLPMFTIDVEEIGGSRAWRLTGLWWQS